VQYDISDPAGGSLARRNLPFCIIYQIYLNFYLKFNNKEQIPYTPFRHGLTIILNSTNIRRKRYKLTEATDTVNKAEKALTSKEGKYLTFNMADEEYGIGILKIKEIIGMLPITSLPQTPPFVKGVINLRGKVIPVIDLRLRFGMEEIEYTERTCIIVIEALCSQMEKCWEVKGCQKNECPAYESNDLRCWMISGTFCRDEIQGSFHEKIEACRKCNFYRKAQIDQSVIVMGIVVDSVSEVLNIKESDIEDAPSFGIHLDTKYIFGMAKMDGGVKILLDIDKVLNSEEVALLKEAA
jgi:chemotaxis signal transduction protein